MAREFSDAELKDFSKDFAELIIDALDRGDVDAARHWCRRFDETKHVIHDTYVHWIVTMMTIVHKELGEARAVKMIRELVSQAGDVAWHMKKHIVEQEGLRGWVNVSMDIWRHHGSFPGLTVTEDDEKVTLSLENCGSGGKLINQGYFEGPDAYARIAEPGPHTWGEANVPIYCTHCTLAHELMPIEALGEGAQLWVHEGPYPKAPNQPCVHHYYKDPANIPRSYYNRFRNFDKPSDENLVSSDSADKG